MLAEDSFPWIPARDIPPREGAVRVAYDFTVDFRGHDATIWQKCRASGADFSVVVFRPDRKAEKTANQRARANALVRPAGLRFGVLLSLVFMDKVLRCSTGAADLVVRRKTGADFGV